MLIPSHVASAKDTLDIAMFFDFDLTGKETAKHHSRIQSLSIDSQSLMLFYYN
jgi:hypothetical protein